MSEFKFNIGQVAVDRITGFRGVVTARCQYMFSVNSYQIQDEHLTENGSIPECEWLSEGRLVEA